MNTLLLSRGTNHAISFTLRIPSLPLSNSFINENQALPSDDSHNSEKVPPICHVQLPTLFFLRLHGPYVPKCGSDKLSCDLYSRDCFIPIT